ncbi:unnamed protein product [Aphanomyces euteiches]
MQSRAQELQEQLISAKQNLAAKTKQVDAAVELVMTSLKRARDSSSYYRQNRNIKVEFMRARECAKVLPLQADMYQLYIRLETKKSADPKLTAENTDYRVNSFANREYKLQASNEEIQKQVEKTTEQNALIRAKNSQVQKLIDEHLRRETINSNDKLTTAQDQKNPGDRFSQLYSQDVEQSQKEDAIPDFLQTSDWFERESGLEKLSIQTTHGANTSPEKIFDKIDRVPSSVDQLLAELRAKYSGEELMQEILSRDCGELLLAFNFPYPMHPLLTDDSDMDDILDAPFELPSGPEEIKPDDNIDDPEAFTPDFLETSNFLETSCSSEPIEVSMETTQAANTSPEKIFEKKMDRVASGVDQLLADFLETSCDIELDYLEISQPFIQMIEGPNAPPSPTKPQSGPAKPCCTPSTGSIARVMPLESSQISTKAKHVACPQLGHTIIPNRLCHMITNPAMANDADLKVDAQAAVNEIIRSHLIDNPMDSVARQIRRVYAKLHEKEKALLAVHTDDVDGSIIDAKMAPIRAKSAKKLRELLEKGCMELHKQRLELTTCIDIVERRYRDGSLMDKESKRSSGVESHETSISLETGSQVAARVARSHELWILASVVKADDRVVEVEDEDSGDEETEGKRHHVVPRDWLIPLPREDQIDDWISYRLNERVMAMYPSTTSFYPATVVVPNPPGSLYVIVRFDDDADEIGINPERKVPFRFVVPLKKT